MRAHAKSCVNPRPSDEFVLCMDCARWGSRGPDRECSHVNKMDFSSVSPSDLDEIVEMAERHARRREEARDVLGLLGRFGSRLVAQGKATEINATKVRSVRSLRVG